MATVNVTVKKLPKKLNVYKFGKIIYCKVPDVDGIDMVHVLETWKEPEYEYVFITRKEWNKYELTG